ncbi:hypothetical protein ABDF71_21925 [Ochrobactrum sp. WV_118_8]
MLEYALFVEGLSELTDLDKQVDPRIVQAAYRAINSTADRARTDSADEIRRQLNFPAAYLKPSQGRLIVSQRANSSSLEAIITGRRRATSLARFVTSGTPGKRGVNVAVKPGRNVAMPSAFLMKLRSGNDIETKNNLGLAIRTSKGARPDGAYKPTRIADGLWLLYGPSVDQAFKSVRKDVTPDAERHLASEFSRLLDLRI